ncbi:MAG: hypothetical protein LBK23_12650 [Oscillospiraceae bacterium]|jgi:hypothetical protein|nr:hypothetical protein [Oscillospiraceae bacterium]
MQIMKILTNKFIKKQYDRKISKIELKSARHLNPVLTASFIIEITLIIISNLFLGDYFSRLDSSVYYEATREMWRTKSIILSEFSFQSQPLVGTNIMIAAPLFGLIGNARVAYGIANCFSTIIFVCAVFRVLQNTGMSLDAKFIILCLVFSLYSVADLLYGGLLFVSAAGYVWQVIAMILHFDNCLRFENNNISFRKNWASLAIFYIVIFFVCINFGLLYFACALLPITLFYFIKFLVEEDIKNLFRSKYIFQITAFIVGCVGVAVYYILGKYLIIESIGHPIISGIDALPTYLPTILFALLGMVGYPYATNRSVTMPGYPIVFGSTSVMSIDGVLSICKFALIIAIIGGAIYIAMKYIREKITDKSALLVYLCFSVIALNIFFVVISYMNYDPVNNMQVERYLIFTSIALFFISGKAFDILVIKIKESKKWLSAFYIYSITLLVVVVCVMSSAYEVVDLTLDSYPYNNTAYARDVVHMSNEAGAAVILSTSGYLDDPFFGFPKRIRGISDDIPVITAWADFNGAYLWGASTRYLDNSALTALGETAAIVALPDAEFAWPEHIRNEATLLKDYGYFKLWTAPTRLFDFA